MTDEQKENLFGRAAFELKAAEDDLRRLSAKADGLAAELAKLSKALTARVKAAESRANFPAGNQDEPLQLGRIDVPFDLDVLKELDNEIAIAVGRVVTARGQYERTKP